MNLWAKSLRQLAVIAVALFFFSCEDDTISGYKTNPKFTVTYKEFDVPSSVILLDSVRTSNYSTGELTRILVGELTDDNFGKVKATAFSQFFTSTNLRLPNTAVFDSISLQLRFDLYYQGSKSASTQTIEVYELQETINPDSAQYYFNKSQNTVAGFLGSKTFTFKPLDFDYYLATPSKADTAVFLTVPFNDDGSDLGQRLFTEAEKYRDTPEIDTTLVTYREFTELFKGIAITTSSSDKMMGFNPQGSFVKVSYHEQGKTDTLSFNLFLGPVGISYTRLEADRSSSPLAGLTDFSTPFVPGNDLRYIQSGTGIATEIDLQEFLDFLDADSNKNLIINEAELLISEVETLQFDPLNVLSLRLLNDQHRPIRIATTADSLANANGNAALIRQRLLYSNYLNLVDGIYTPMTERLENVSLSKTTDNSYPGYPTFFLQQLHNKNGKRIFSKYALYPQSPSFSKSLNGLVFNKNNLKLRITYTRPI
jgi:hypothetical protein